jgi:glycosyltransferase involved in cell wall biosynthesis
MSHRKIKVVHFHNGTGGGVLSVIRNMFAYKKHPEIENHIIYTINREQVPVFNSPDLVGAASEQIFYYSPKWNFYYTCRQLAKLLFNKDTLIVAHDWLELGMVTQLGLENPVIQFIHGDYDYYYKLAYTHESSVNAFICVSSAICKKMVHLLPSREENIAYLELPVRNVIKTNESRLGDSIVFIGRCEEEKGYPLLPHIETKLKARGFHFKWHIYGEGSTDKNKMELWSKQSNVSFYGKVSGEEIMMALPKYDFLVLPTIAEGLPVTVIEAMKCGVVPIVNHLPGGIEELIGNNQRGWLIEQNKVENYTRALTQLVQEPKRVKTLAKEARDFACKKFDANNCTKAIEIFILANKLTIKHQKAKKVYGSRLDLKWLPNWFVSSFRSVINY